MLIQETSVFTRLITSLMPDDEYHELQTFLVAHPGKGVLIPGSGGLRKIRWTGSGRGKSGGTRIIYYWGDPEILLMLFVYKKNETGDLTPRQLQQLRILAKEWHNENQ